jgi:hypothetical protein
MAPWAKSTLFTVWEELPGLNGNSSSVVRQTELKYSIFIPMCLGQGFQCRLGKSLPSPGTPLGAAVPNSLRPWCRETSGPCCLSSANCPQVLSSFSIWIWIPLHCTTGIQCCFIHTHTHTHARTHARTHTHTHTRYRWNYFSGFHLLLILLRIQWGLNSHHSVLHTAHIHKIWDLSFLISFKIPNLLA